MREERERWIAIANSKKVQNSELKDTKELKALSFEGIERGKKGSGSPLPIVREFKTPNSKF